MLLGIRFEGGLADEHKIPAYEGTKSLEGLTRSILIVSNYLVEGRVRRREFERTPLTFNLVAHRPGSFDSLYEIAYQAAVFGPAIGEALAGGVAGNLLTDFLKNIYRRVTGQPDEEMSAAMQRLEADRPGDVAAIAEAIEPSVRLGHNVINHGVINININYQAPAARNEIVRFTPRTKQYIWESAINNNPRIKLFSVSSFNANQGTGRAFDLEEGRSIPFELSEDADRLSIDTLLGSISQYTRRRRLGDDLRSAVAIRYTSIDALDGRIKKIRIHSVRGEIAQL